MLFETLHTSELHVFQGFHAVDKLNLHTYSLTTWTNITKVLGIIGIYLPQFSTVK